MTATRVASGRIAITPVPLGTTVHAVPGRPTSIRVSEASSRTMKRGAVGAEHDVRSPGGSHLGDDGATVALDDFGPAGHGPGRCVATERPRSRRSTLALACRGTLHDRPNRCVAPTATPREMACFRRRSWFPDRRRHALARTRRRRRGPGSAPGRPARTRRGRPHPAFGRCEAPCRCSRSSRAQPPVVPATSSRPLGLNARSSTRPGTGRTAPDPPIARSSGSVWKAPKPFRGEGVRERFGQLVVDRESQAGSGRSHARRGARRAPWPG